MRRVDFKQAGLRAPVLSLCSTCLFIGQVCVYLCVFALALRVQEVLIKREINHICFHWYHAFRLNRDCCTILSSGLKVYISSLFYPTLLEVPMILWNFLLLNVRRYTPYLALKSECSFRSGGIGGAPANDWSWIRLKSKRVSTCSPTVNALPGLSVRETSNIVSLSVYVYDEENDNELPKYSKVYFTRTKIMIFTV